MKHNHVIPDYKVRLTDAAIAKLLGISIDEYHSLSHLPLDADTDITGQVIGFHMHISTNNNPGLLSKLKRDKNNVVKFRPEEVYRMYK